MSVYAISGFNNSNYEGIFTLLFSSEEKMIAEVEDMIASDMGLSRAAFIRLRREDRAKFDNWFTDSGDRTYEKCLEEGAYYCSNGYELSWGEYEVR